jgi:hypothetical protein
MPGRVDKLTEQPSRVWPLQVHKMTRPSRIPYRMTASRSCPRAGLKLAGELDRSEARIRPQKQP